MVATTPATTQSQAARTGFKSTARRAAASSARCASTWALLTRVAATRLIRWVGVRLRRWTTGSPSGVPGQGASMASGPGRPATERNAVATMIASSTVAYLVGLVSSVSRSRGR